MRWLDAEWSGQVMFQEAAAVGIRPAQKRQGGMLEALQPEGLFLNPLPTQPNVDRKMSRLHG
jgi:hypothetical protein